MSKKFIFIYLIINFQIWGQWTGSGTVGDPYQITSAENLAALATSVSSGTNYDGIYFKLMNDIDLSTYLSESGAGYNGGSLWLPIGNSSTNFRGKFDGNSKVISNLRINRPSSDNIGLFGVINGGVNCEIKNLGITIDPASAVIGRQYVGGLVGDNRGTIIESYVTGKVVGHAYIGGLTGYQGGFVRRCYSEGTVEKGTTSNSRFGGFAGYNAGTIENCYSRSSVSASGLTYVGGFCGENYNANISNSYSTGFVDANTSGTVGGFIGYYDNGSITKCFWDTQTSGKASSQGTDVTGKTTIQMKTSSTFTDAGWDGGIWNIDGAFNNGYPYLDWQNTGGTPLPVELTSFTAEFKGSSATIEKSVELKWTTATEVNNYGFNLERRSKSKEWQKIAFVQGHGNSNSPKNYSYMDINIPSGLLQYRLKQLDFDGAFQYSQIVDVNIEASTEFKLEQNYPNPFNPVTTIKYSIPTGVEMLQATSLRVYDILGKEVAVLVSEPQTAGNYEVKFDASHAEHGRSMASGIYFYKLQSGQFVQTKKFILMK